MINDIFKSSNKSAITTVQITFLCTTFLYNKCNALKKACNGFWHLVSSVFFNNRGMVYTMISTLLNNSLNCEHVMQCFHAAQMH